MLLRLSSLFNQGVLSTRPQLLYNHFSFMHPSSTVHSRLKGQSHEIRSVIKIITLRYIIAYVFLSFIVVFRECLCLEKNPPTDIGFHFHYQQLWRCVRLKLKVPTGEKIRQFFMTH